MVECGERLYAGGIQLVHQSAIKVQTFLVWPAHTFRKDSRPGDGEAVSIGAKALHQGDVFLIAVVVIIGDVAVVAVLNLPFGVGVCVPDGRSLAVLIPGALNLIGRSGDTPIIPFGKRTTGTFLRIRNFR